MSATPVVLSPFLPCVPSAPTTADAPLSALNLFQPFANRAAYQAANGGVQLAPFDKTRPIKMYEDRSGATSYTIAQVNAYNADNPTGPLVSFVSMAAPANPTANIPGPYVYPPWSNSAQSDVTQTGLDGTVDGLLLCLFTDAEMAAQVYATSTGMPYAAPTIDPVSLGYIYPASEPRRQWLIAGMNAASALALMTVQIIGTTGYQGGGYGAPGILTQNGQNWNWALTPDPGLTATGVPTPIPCITPWAGWSVGAGAFGVPELINSAVVTPPSSDGGSGLTAAQAAALAEIPGMAANIQALCEVFRITPQ
jgi:hypothetical protein